MGAPMVALVSATTWTRTSGAADAAGVVLTRMTADHDLERHLDGVQLAPGFSYAEEYVGTNGIGTALEGGQPAAVFGHEHYAEDLEDLACAGVPIHHPISGKVVGAVDLTCWRKHADRLLIALVKLLHGWAATSLTPAVPLLNLLRDAIWIWLPVYLFLMQKKVYRQGWFMTTIKYGMIGISYIVLLTLGLAAAAIVSLTIA